MLNELIHILVVNSIPFSNYQELDDRVIFYYDTLITGWFSYDKLDSILQDYNYEITDDYTLEVLKDE